jgi:hypothetical protein
VAVLLVRDPSSRITVVDRDERAIQEVSSYPVEAVVADGLCYLSQSLQKGQPVDYIIPAVPFHLAFEAVLWQLRPLGAERRPAPVLAGLSQPHSRPDGRSLYQFCPSSMPQNLCGPCPLLHRDRGEAGEAALPGLRGNVCVLGIVCNPQPATGVGRGGIPARGVGESGTRDQGQAGQGRSYLDQHRLPLPRCHLGLVVVAV